jgi:4-oxalocrotonate tautomerase
MPHVIVKLWPGKSEAQKERLAERIAQDVMEVLDYGEESVSVAMEEVKSSDWAREVYQPDIKAKWGTLYKKPGYTM